MDAVQLFLTRYDGTHTVTTERVFDGLTDDEARRRPHPAVNSIAWLLWHIARFEDVGLSRLVADRPQLFDEGRWATRLGVPRRDGGFGMTLDEVDGLSRAVDLGALRAYWSAVGERTVEIAGALRPERLDEVVGPEEARRVLVDEAVGAHPADQDGLARIWTDRTRGWYLMQLGLAHNVGHLYDMQVVRGMLLHDRARTDAAVG
jgi:DinB superfamily